MLSDEEYGAALLRPLDREPTGPSTVDVMRAVDDGRRYRRRARVAGVAGVVAATALVVSGGATVVGWGRHAPPSVDPRPPAASATLPSPSPTTPAGPSACTLQRLPVPAGQPPKSLVTGGDPTGRYVLGRSYPGGQSHPLLIWDNGQVRTVAMTGQDQELVDINSTGTVAVGNSFVGPKSDQETAWVYHDGVMTRLPGNDTSVAGVNDRGVMVGQAGGKPVTWASPTSAPTALSVPAGWTGAVSAIDENGTMVGSVSPSGPGEAATPYLWHPDGSGEPLPMPVVNGQPVTLAMARAIRGDWVVGWAGLDVDKARYVYAPRWNLRTGKVDTDTFPGLAYSVNASGWVAGESGPAAMLGTGGERLTLPDLGATGTLVVNIAYTVSDDGAVLAGQAQTANGDPVAVEWHCH